VGYPTPLPQRTYGYDAVGNVTRISEPTRAGPQLFRYDARGRPTSTPISIAGHSDLTSVRHASAEKGFIGLVRTRPQASSDPKAAVRFGRAERVRLPLVAFVEIRYTEAETFEQTKSAPYCSSAQQG